MLITCPECRNEYSASYEVCPMCRKYQTTLRQRADYMLENRKDYVVDESIRSSFARLLMDVGYPQIEAEQIVYLAAQDRASAIRKAGLSRIMLATLIGLVGAFVCAAGFLDGRGKLLFAGMSIINAKAMSHCRPFSHALNPLL